MRSRFTRFSVCALPLVLGLWATEPSALAIKVMSYNLLNFPSSTGNDRAPGLRRIIADANPDVIMCCEMDDSSGAVFFLNNVLNFDVPGAWEEHDHFDNGGGGLSESVLFYRVGVVEPTGTGNDRSTFINTSPRITPRWKLRPVGYGASSNTFYVYGAHLKAADSGPDAAERAAAAADIRANANLFPSNTRFIICGDMNFYTSAEVAYDNFTATTGDNDGRVVDVLNPELDLQSWSTSSFFASMHTQSTRTSNPPSQAGALGGLDDRFDFIFMSDVLNGTAGISYIAGTYREYGNDNAHFNKAVNATPANTDVSAIIADDLTFCSDHLPVLAEFRAPADLILDTTSLAFGTVLVGAAATLDINVSNDAPSPGETATYTYFQGVGMNFSGPVGLQSVVAGGGQIDTITMNTATSGIKDQTTIGNPAFNVQTNNRESPFTNPFRIFATGTVLDHGVPSTESGSQVLSAPLDFGTHDVGAFADQVAEVHNVGFDALQSLIDVWEHAIVDDGHGRFSLVNAPPADAGASPAQFTVHFDDTGALPGQSFTATLTFHNRDPVGLPGAVALADVVYNLSAMITAAPTMQGDFDDSGSVDCPDVPVMVDVLLGIDTDPGHVALADMNADTAANGDDVNPFLDALVCP